MSQLSEELIIKISAQISELQKELGKALSEVVGTNKKMVSATVEGSEKMGNAFGGVGISAKKMATAVIESTNAVNKGIGELKEASFGGLELAALLETGKQVVDAFKEFGQAGIEAKHLAEKTGMTVEAVSKLNFAAESAHVSADTLDTGVTKLAKTMTQAHAGTAKAVEALAHFGITTADLHNKAFGLSDAFAKIADKTKSVGDGFLKTGEAQAVLGKGAGSLIPLLNQGSAGIAEFGKKADELGVTLTDKVQNAQSLVNESFLNLDQTMQGLKNTVMTGLAPAFASAVNWFTSALKEGGSLNNILHFMEDLLESVGHFFTELWHAAKPALQGVGDMLNLAGDDTLSFGSIVKWLVEEVFTNLINMVKAVSAVFIVAFGSIKAVITDVVFACMQLVSGMSAVGSMINDALHGNWDKIKGDWDAGNRALADNSATHADQIKGIYDGMAQHLASTFAGVHDSEETMLGKKEGGGPGNENEDTGDAKKGKTKKEKKPKAEKDMFAELKNELGDIEETEKVSDGKRLGFELEFWNAKLKTAKKGTAEYRQIQTEIRNLEKQVAKEREQALKTEEAGQLAHDKAIFAQKKSAIESELSLGHISKQQELSALMEFDRQEYAEELATLDKYILTLDVGTNAYAVALNQRAALNDAFNLKIQQATEKSAQAQAAAVKTALQPITAAIQQSVNGMIAGTTTMKQALSNIFKSIMGEFVSMLAKQVSSWIVGQITQTAAAAAGATARVTIAKAAAKATAKADQQSGQSAISSAAATGAAKAYQAIVGIPYVGPILAPIAAAVAFVGIEAFGSRLGSARGGWGQIPSDQIAQLHKDEMVLPADIAGPMRDMTRGGGGAGGTTVNLSALDMRSVADAMRRNPDALAGAVQHAHRLGHLGSYQ